MSLSASPTTTAPMPVEIIVGFRPGRDHVPVVPGERISVRQEAGDVVIDRGAHGLVVLQGISIIDLIAGVEPSPLN